MDFWPRHIPARFFNFGLSSYQLPLNNRDRFGLVFRIWLNHRYLWPNSLFRLNTCVFHSRTYHMILPEKKTIPILIISTILLLITYSHEKSFMYSVLYVDDEKSLLEIAQIFLEQSGNFSVSIITSAMEALNSPALGSYDAIISDYQIPVMDGIAFLKAVRDRFRDVPLSSLPAEVARRSLSMQLTMVRTFTSRKGVIRLPSLPTLPIRSRSR